MPAALPATIALPEATPAAADLVCWLWAALPPKNGRIHVARAAAALGVSDTTIRRWIRDAAHLRLNDAGMTILRRRAILRGRGTYLWPDLDPASIARSAANLRNARVCLDRIAAGNPLGKWATDGTLEPHTVMLVHYRKARTYGVASARTDSSRARIMRVGDIVEEAVLPNKHAAVVAKQLTLAQHHDQRCVAPRKLVPTGRTETWRERAGSGVLVLR